MDRGELERLDREGLVKRAEGAGVRRARLLTRPELIDELLRREPGADRDRAQLKKSRGFFGIARDLLSRVVERGLHLPDAADRLRVALGSSLPQVPRPEPQAVPTVTLAEIYAAQGHKGRAIETLRRVLETEPEHAAARALLERLTEPTYVAPSPPLPPEPDDAGNEIGAHLGTAELVAAVAPASSEAETLRRAPVASECVAIPLDRGRSFVWWQLSPQGRRLADEATFRVRAVILVPTWDGPRREVRDVSCDPAAGELILEGLPEGAVVRVAVGTVAGGELVPLAHSPALETSTLGLVEWTLAGPVPVSLNTTAAVSRAAERARQLGSTG